jgi:lipoprotein NlpI
MTFTRTMKMLCLPLPAALLLLVAGSPKLAADSTPLDVLATNSSGSSGAIQDSKSETKKLIELQKKTAARIYVLNNRAKASARKGKYDDAIRTLDEIVKISKSADALRTRGELHFLNADFEKAVSDFDEMIKLTPNTAPYLWQRGLALYYTGEYQKGVDQFELHQKVNSQDVENAVWHFLCVARLDGVDQARKRLIKISADTRVPMKQIHDHYAGTGTVADVLAAARKRDDRAKKLNPKAKQTSTYYAYLYIGLYYEVSGKPELAIETMKKANSIRPFDKSVLMGGVAAVHLKARAKGSSSANEKSKNGRN